MSASAPEQETHARHRRRFLRFGGAGALSAITDFVVFGALIAVGWPAAPANVASFLVANVQSYFLNARLTFGDRHRGAPVSVLGYGRFFLAHLVSLVGSTALIAAAAPAIGALPAKAIAALLAALWNYAAAATFVFRKEQRENDPRESA
jgi:putative flippase GtrA